MEDSFIKNDEEIIFKDIDKKFFYNWLEKEGFDFDRLKNIFECQKIDSNEQNKFNNILKKCKLQIGLDINDMILFFEDDLIRLKKILNVIDESVRNIVKRELSKKYCIKISRSNLYQIIS